MKPVKSTPSKKANQPGSSPTPTATSQPVLKRADIKKQDGVGSVNSLLGLGSGENKMVEEVSISS
jgi:hypothetical protein